MWVQDPFLRRIPTVSSPVCSKLHIQKTIFVAFQIKRNQIMHKKRFYMSSTRNVPKYITICIQTLQQILYFMPQSKFIRITNLFLHRDVKDRLLKKKSFLHFTNTQRTFQVHNFRKIIAFKIIIYIFLPLPNVG